ncbi:cupredoxin domain-containing protein [Streptomyces fulvoviolaceus]|uniref:cupredoxin domain-containing protein n=1 Tax=Streptomyces fulvoviolaceus TaxID=285535 RepID=UPI000ADEE163|nr:cupredoxin family copper-binding protein [Streptomyces fulvoviolaceus]
MRAAQGSIRSTPGRAVRSAAVIAVLALLALPLLPSGQASAASYSVAMKGYAFSPATLSVPAGSTVTWTNYDTAPHDVKTTSGPVSIHSPMLDKGDTWSFTFGTAGSYGYYCTVHPDMTAGITVRAAAPATTSKAPATHQHTSSSTSSTSSGHHATEPTRTAASSMPSMSMPPSTSPTTAGAAASNAPQASGSPQTAAQLPATQTTASTVRPLDPLLVLAGLVAGVAVLCLLLVGSRAASAPRGGAEEE